MQDILLTILWWAVVLLASLFTTIAAHEASHHIASVVCRLRVYRTVIGHGPLLGACCAYWVTGRFYGWALQLSPWPYCIVITKATGRLVRFSVAGPDHNGNYGTPMDPNFETDPRWNDFTFGTIYEIRLFPLGGSIMAGNDPERPWADTVVSLSGPLGHILFGAVVIGMLVPGVDTAYIGKAIILSGIGNLIPVRDSDGWRVLRAWFGDKITCPFWLAVILFLALLLAAL